MSERCYKCFRPIERCLCKFVTPPINAGVKFIFLMHPKEAKRNRTGTGRISHAALTDSEILVGIDFSENLKFKSLLTDQKYLPLLLYPGEEAMTAHDLANRNLIGKKEINASRKIPLVIVIDATWFCARKIIEHNQFLLELPRISFAGNYRSIFTFKREPRPEYVSTVESCYYLIREMQDAGIVQPDVDAEPLMNVFKEMVRQQLQAENDRIEGKLPDTHSYNWKYKKRREIPDEIKLT